MCNCYEYFKAQCHICGDVTEVRTKNIWLIGSEGTDMCWSCEKDMINYLNSIKKSYLHKKLKKIKSRFKNK